jgi:hypothetical protein
MVRVLSKYRSEQCGTTAPIANRAETPPRSERCHRNPRTPTGDRPGSATEETEQCHDCCRLTRPGQRYFPPL